MNNKSRRTFLKQAALGAAVLAYPTAKVLGANNRVRVGMIGVGDRGNDLLGQIRSVPNVDVVAMADVYSRRRDQAKNKVPGIQTFDDHRRLLDMKDIDAVIVASPLHIHARHFLDTLAAGKDLYSEKTMTWSIPEADKCLAAAKNSGRVVQIGLQYESSGALHGHEAVGERRLARQRHSRRIMDEPQHAAWQRPVGESRAVGLHRAECELERVSEWPARPPVRPVQAHQLATVLGIFGRQLRRKHGPSDRVDHVCSGSPRCLRPPICLAASSRKKMAAKSQTRSRSRSIFRRISS